MSMLRSFYISMAVCSHSHLTLPLPPRGSLESSALQEPIPALSSATTLLRTIVHDRESRPPSSHRWARHVERCTRIHFHEGYSCRSLCQSCSCFLIIESAEKLTPLLGYGCHRGSLRLHNFSPPNSPYPCYLHSDCLQFAIPPLKKFAASNKSFRR